MFNNLTILTPFLEEPTREFHLREIARILNISPATAKTYLNTPIIKKRKERIYSLYKANIENQAYRDLKVYYNITRLRSSNIIAALNDFYLKPTIILFGSASTGYDIENSDLDLCVISEKTTTPNLKPYEKKLNRTIQLFAVKNLKQLKNNQLINNVLNGVVLQGSIKWK